MLQTNDEDETAEFNDSSILRTSILIYGGILLGIIIVFSWLRRRFPKVYNVRSWVDSLKTFLAEDQYKCFSWMWRVYAIADDDIMEECGMDAACFIRLLQMGFRLSMVGVFNTIWLLPIYVTAPWSSETADVTDGVVKTTVAHVPPGSDRLYATVLASYILFGYTMYLILQEFEWYIEMRHKFLRKPLIRHFAVFVRNIPSDYRTNASLEAFFRGCFSDSDVLEARLAIKAPNIAKAVVQRDETLANLEHALALYKRDGSRPHHKHKDKCMGLGKTVDSIDHYTSQLEEQNKDVAQRLATLGPIARGFSADADAPEVTSTNDEADYPDKQEDFVAMPAYISPVNASMQGMESTEVEIISGDLVPQSVHEGEPIVTTGSTARDIADEAATVDEVAPTAEPVAANHVATSSTSLAQRAVSMVMGGEDGEVFPAGFVVFSNISTTNAALQMVHHKTPFAMEVLEAPDPDTVFWGNVSCTHKSLQLGKLASSVLTTALCLFWTVPMSFFASLANSSDARQDYGWLDEFFDQFPSLVPLTEQLAPFLVIIFNSLLPAILEAISKLEGPISSGVVQALTFAKLATFMIIQTFFVSAISGAIMPALSEIIEDWTKAIDLLATALPKQGTYFMQILIVSTAISGGMEMLRVVPVVKAFLRSKIGPNLTEKERAKTYCGLSPLSVPDDFDHASGTAQLVLYFMVLFVYCVISPIVPIITGLCFAFLGAMFRGQFIYIYANHPDSGGKVWVYFIQIMMSCMLIAQVTIFGLLGLKQAVIQTAVLVPLLIITVLFNSYIRQEHFKVAAYLPTGLCVEEDLRRDENFDFSFVHDAYVQPPLAAKADIHPDPSLLDSATEKQLQWAHDESNDPI